MQLLKTSKVLSMFTSISKQLNLSTIVVLIIAKHRLIAYTRVFKMCNNERNTLVRWHLGVTFPSAFFYFSSAFFYFPTPFFYFNSPFFYFPSSIFYFPLPFLLLLLKVCFTQNFFTSLENFFLLSFRVFFTPTTVCFVNNLHSYQNIDIVKIKLRYC